MKCVAEPVPTDDEVEEIYLEPCPEIIAEEMPDSEIE
jgi:hypothetical protein